MTKGEFMNIKLRLFLFVTFIGAIASLNIAVPAQTRAYRVSDRQVKALLTRIEQRTDNFKNNLDRSLDNSNVDGTRREDSINTVVGNFETATNNLKNNFSSRRSTANDVQEVLNRAVFINNFMMNNRMNQNAENGWNLLRTDLNTLAGYYNLSPNWQNTGNNTNNGGGIIATDQQMRNLLNSLTARTRTFSLSLDRWSRTYNGRNSSGSVADARSNTTQLANSIRDMSRRFDRNAGSNQVEALISNSMSINRFVTSNRMTSDVTNNWNLVRRDLDTLAGYYRVSSNWNNTPTNGGQYGAFDSMLTGTYRLNSGSSDNVSRMVDDAVRKANFDNNQAERVRRNLERRLTSPETLSFEKSGRQVTMSSSNAASVTLNADGVSQTETGANGRNVTTSVTSTDRDLTINYEGDRMNDFYVSFVPQNNGQLRVTRRVYLENQNQTVTVSSVYDKVSRVPQWNNGVNLPNNGGSTNGTFLIANNTQIVASLDGSLSTKTARDGDRFTMTVTSPDQYRGAIIEGTVYGQKSGVVSGNANMSMNFETIRMRNGATYRFAGVVEQVRTPNGDTIQVNNEGSIRDGSQTTKTVTRTGIGAVLGAIIGAIVDGGSGAAIGAGIGAGAGAGSVVLQGRDNLELGTGTQFNITASAPSNVTGRN